MGTERPIRVVFFRSAAGTEPVRDWLKALPREERKAIGVDILAVQFAWPVGKPLVDHLGGGIWEIRSRPGGREVRTLFAMAGGEMVLLHGFIKKSRATPRREIELAARRLRQYGADDEDESKAGR